MIEEERSEVKEQFDDIVATCTKVLRRHQSDFKKIVVILTDTRDEDTTIVLDRKPISLHREYVTPE